jgi:hypothetical protein
MRSTSNGEPGWRAAAAVIDPIAASSAGLDVISFTRPN